MIKEYLNIAEIPSVLFGDNDSKLLIAIHGNMSHKEDEVIIELAKTAVKKGYKVLSFDLPEHGDRKKEGTICNIENSMKTLNAIMNYSKSISKNISLFACSMGTYFSLLTYKDENIKSALFLSPVIDMKSIIDGMMNTFQISEDQLKTEGEILTPIGQKLYWDYYSYIKNNPITKRDNKTSILYGSKDNLCNIDTIKNFSKNFNCHLTIMDEGEHYFHTNEQLNFFEFWLENHL